MRLKRIYDEQELKAWKESGCKPNETPKAVMVQVEHGPDRQKFPSQMVAEAVREGWLTFDKGCVVLKTTEGDMRYKVNRVPGLYCCHCAKSLQSSVLAHLHVAAEHKHAASPDPNNPSGYERLNAYDCVREA